MRRSIARTWGNASSMTRSPAGVREMSAPRPSAGFGHRSTRPDLCSAAMRLVTAAVTGADITARITRAVQRVAGTLAGVLAAAAILAPHLPVPVLIAVIAALQAATELCVGRNYALAVIFLTPLALAMGTLAQPVGTWTLLHDRAIETVLGAVIGAAIALAAHVRRPITRGGQRMPSQSARSSPAGSSTALTVSASRPVVRLDGVVGRPAGLAARDEVDPDPVDRSATAC